MEGSLPSLADAAKRMDPNGQVANIAMLLSETNMILKDAVYKETNQPQGEQITVQTGLPEVAWHVMNRGVLPSNGETEQLVESVAILEALSTIDIYIAGINGNTPEFLLSESRMHMEAMNQKMASTMFYGDTFSIKDGGFLGLSPRYNSLKGPTGARILDAGGTKNKNTSVYLVGWGLNGVYNIFPKGTQAGLEADYRGVQTVTGSDGRQMLAHQTWYHWHTGLVVKDWRRVVRICNIDIDDLTNLTGTQALDAPTSIFNLMMRAASFFEGGGNLRPTFYANPHAYLALSMQGRNFSQSVMSVHSAATQFGTPQIWRSYLDIPIRQCDALRNDEKNVT